MPRSFQIFSQSDNLIQIFYINLHTEWRTVQIQISWLLRRQLIWIYNVCKGRVYPGSAGQGLSKYLNSDFYALCTFKTSKISIVTSQISRKSSTGCDRSLRGHYQKTYHKIPTYTYIRAQQDKGKGNIWIQTSMLDVPSKPAKSPLWHHSFKKVFNRVRQKP